MRALLGLILLLVVAAAGVWWWAGQEGSLEWTLQRIARNQPLTSEGVRGSVRTGWRIDRLTWEAQGLKVEARDIRLDWQPLALIGRTFHLEQVGVREVRITDTRPASGEPLQPPASLRLPWRVIVDDVTVGRVDYRGRVQVQGGGLMGRYAFDGLKHEVTVDALQVAGGNYRGHATLLAMGPMTLEAAVGGRVLAPLPGGAPLPLQFEAQVRGPLRQLDAKAQLRAGRGGAQAPQADVEARITPFDAMPVPQGQADFRALDLAPFLAGAPHTQLSGHVDVAPVAGSAWRLRADVRNAAAGPWDAGRLPVASARGEGEWRGGTALIRALDAEVGGGRIEGKGAWEGSGWRFAGNVAGVDPAQLHGQLAALPVSGPVRLEGEGAAIDFDVALKAGAAAPAARRRGKGEAPARPRGDASVQATVRALELRELTAKGRYEGSSVAFAPLRVRASDAALDAEMSVDWKAWAGKGRLELHAPALDVQANGSLSETKGNGTLQVDAADLARLQPWLQRFPAAGKALGALQLRGQANARLAWQGGWHDPAVQGRIQATRLQWQITPAGANAPLPWVLPSATLQVNGRLRDAALDLQAQAESGQRNLQLAAGGRLSGTLGPAASWRGQLASLRLQLQDPGLAPGPWVLQLRQPVAWRFAAGDIEVAAGDAVLQAPPLKSGAAATEAVLAWGPLRRHGGQLTTSGRISGLPLAWVELVGGQQLAGSVLSGDMVFDAQWNAQLGATLRVDASLARVRGDVMVLAETAEGGSTRVSAGVRQARITLRSQGDELALALLWDSERAGHAEGQVRTRLARTDDGGWDWPESAPLAGRVQAQLPRIGVWSLLAPPGWRLRGSLGADITVAGTRRQPQLSGPLRADQLALRSVVEGIEFANGRLRARLQGEKLVVDEFMLRGAEEKGSSGGTLVASGEGELTAEGMRLRVNAQLSQLRASIRSDRELTVSGPVAARVDREGVNVTGKLVVDRARIEIPEETAPRLGDDVVVRNAPGVAATEAERRMKPQSSNAARTLTMAVSFDLGSDFRVSGRGVDTRLAGEVQVSAKGSPAPQLTGLIRTVGGTYEAYGQKLRIERGELRFTGAPDNPALDVLAIRPNMAAGQQVGVQVTGRAQAPHVELYSEPALSEAETLSWLVLGRSSSGGGAETALLQRAAAALLAGRKGSGKKLAGSFGLDDVSFGRDTSGSPIVSLGKRFAENFYASYERGISSATGTLYLFYDVSRRLTVRAEAGERTGLDLIFTFFIDRKK